MIRYRVVRDDMGENHVLPVLVSAAVGETTFPTRSAAQSSWQQAAPSAATSPEAPVSPPAPVVNATLASSSLPVTN
ncbi:MAG: hypothetical protein HQ581_24555 [Planctomycetes bacterium]|nr:hypothetical protein [Planctomycetota bacterium]